jgi:hypothetical protein
LYYAGMKTKSDSIAEPFGISAAVRGHGHVPGTRHRG